MNLFYEFERLGYGWTGADLFFILGSKEGGWRRECVVAIPPPPHIAPQ